VIWVQGGLSFALWIGYGWFLSRRSEALRAQLNGLGRGLRAGGGAGLILIAAMVMIGGLGIVLQQGGFTPAGLTPVAWIVTTFLGIGFVHAQVLGTAMLITLIQPGVTNLGVGPSTHTEPENLLGGDQTQ
jgi:hypothetical protein